MCGGKLRIRVVWENWCLCRPLLPHSSSLICISLGGEKESARMAWGGRKASGTAPDFNMRAVKKEERFLRP